MYSKHARARLVCEKVVWPKPDQPDRLLRICFILFIEQWEKAKWPDIQLRLINNRSYEFVIQYNDAPVPCGCESTDSHKPQLVPYRFNTFADSTLLAEYPCICCTHGWYLLVLCSYILVLRWRSTSALAVIQCLTRVSTRRFST